MKIILKSFTALFIVLSINSCKQVEEKNNSLINKEHIDFLYQDINVNGVEMGIVHIYSNYPEYKWIGDDDEGIACVDDAARAGIFYLRDYKLTGDRESYAKAKKLLRFMLHMHSENGWFYNFIWDDHSINRDFKTSINIPSWWTWRALWFITESIPFLNDKEVELINSLTEAVDKTIKAIHNEFDQSAETINFNGVEIPLIFPEKYAVDQTSILLLGLINHFEQTSDESVKELILNLSNGILKTQLGDESTFPHYAFMSWKNIWHGYGNLQSYALLRVYEITKNENFLKASLNEIEYFYKWIVKNNFVSSFKLKFKNDEIQSFEKTMFSQIAYNIRPMVWSVIKAYEITNDEKYIDKVVDILLWYFGKNIAEQVMYSRENGKCFDGINNTNTVNKNSGAESTIEALLSLLEVERSKHIKKKLMNRIR